MQFWNPHSTMRVTVIEISLVTVTAPGSGSGVELRRTSARGATPTATVTPAIQQDEQRVLAPPSGAVLELATFGTQPTLEAGGLWAWILAAAAAAGFIYPIPAGLVVPPGTGIALVNRAAIIVPACEVTVVWRETTE